MVDLARYLYTDGAVNVRRDSSADLHAALQSLGARNDYVAYQVRTNINCELERRTVTR